TLMVVWNEPRVDPFSCSQFHPPSSICSPSSRSTSPRTSCRKYEPTETTRPLMHGSTSPSKNGLLSHQCQVTLSRISAAARRASLLDGSSPRSRSHRSERRQVHSGLSGSPPQRPLASWRASNRAPQPSVATFAHSAATSSFGASVRSRITCQRIEGSESSSHCMTDLFGSGTWRLGELVAICWFSLLWLKDAVGGLTVGLSGSGRYLRRLD